MSFKTVSTFSVLGLLVLLFSTANAGISSSKHDLGTGGGGQGSTSATTEICVFCHTPHGSDVSAPAPLWNKTFPSTSYTRYSSLNTSSLDGTEAPVGSVSLACLSCHDGSQAMDVVINKPGSGGYDASGSEISATEIGTMTGTPLPNLGSDLSNDHPISIQYGGGGCSTTDIGCTTMGDSDFVSPATANINGFQQWWVDTSSAGTREKTDMMLYTRTLSGVTQPFVECASCHDPHNASSTPVSFLRIDNENSAVCLACHIK